MINYTLYIDLELSIDLPEFIIIKYKIKSENKKFDSEVMVLDEIEIQKNLAEARRHFGVSTHINIEACILNGYQFAPDLQFYHAIDGCDKFGAISNLEREIRNMKIKVFEV